MNHAYKYKDSTDNWMSTFHLRDIRFNNTTPRCCFESSYDCEHIHNVPS